MKNITKNGLLLLAALFVLIGAFMALPVEAFASTQLLCDAHHQLHQFLEPAHGFALGAAPAITSIRGSVSGANPGGTTRLYVIPWEDVESIPDATGITVATDIVPKAGKSFYEWEFAQDTGKISYKASGDFGSQSFEVEKSVYIPTMTPEIAAILEASINRRFIIVVVDGRGQKVIGGDINRPMQMEANYDSGAKFNEKNGTTMTFKCGSSHVPYFYTGVVPVVAAP